MLIHNHGNATLVFEWHDGTIRILYVTLYPLEYKNQLFKNNKAQVALRIKNNFRTSPPEICFSHHIHRSFAHFFYKNQLSRNSKALIALKIKNSLRISFIYGFIYTNMPCILFLLLKVFSYNLVAKEIKF